MSTDPKTATKKNSPFRDLKNETLVDSGAEERSSEFPSVEFVVGVGASAGGLQSIESLLSKLVPGTNSSLIIVQHFSPDVVSSMDEILTRKTDLNVVMAADGAVLKPDTIFLIPPGQEIRLVKDQIKLNTADRTRITRVVDALFTSLAEYQGARAIGIILSGTGSDGSEGIRAIRGAGGATLAESVESAQFDGMPKNAMQTKCIDMVMPPTEIAEWLNLQFANPSERPAAAELLEPEKLTGIQLIFQLLSKNHEVDFSAYKPSTVARRIERRQQICKQKSIQDYADYASANSEELELLYHDLLIGVTKFFRDTDAFLVLERQLTELVKRIAPGEMLRIWAAGCATGEEAYSLAMLAHDAFERLGREPNYKVFATDIHQRCLDFASRGIYDNETMEYVSNERQATFFTKESARRSRVSTLLRKNMVFARHNVFQDPPFTNMHLVTCRNLLIYLKNDAQLQAIASFHFSLRVDGLMMLGSSETVGPLAEEFRNVDKTWRLFQKIRDRPNLLAQRNADASRLTKPNARQLVNLLNRDRPESMSFTRLVECYDLVLGEFISAGLLLDDDRKILHVFGDARKYLSSRSGPFSDKIGSYLEGAAKAAITSALIRTQRSFGKVFVLEGVEIDVDGSPEVIDVRVRAFDGKTSSNTMVWLVEFLQPRPEAEKAAEPSVRLDVGDGNYTQLESELDFTRDSLSITIEQLESSNQELSAANEELVASNEELQSTNEELESVNEELYTVNLENNRRIDELKEVTDDLEVLLSTSEIGTLFLDAKLCVRKFTRSITSYFNLLPHDIGRPIDNFTNKSGIEHLDAQLKEVLESGETVSEVVLDRDGNMTQVKIVPHLVDDRIAGVILTLSSHTSPDIAGAKPGIWQLPDVKAARMSWSEECFTLLGYEAGSIVPSLTKWKEWTHPDDSYRMESVGTKHCPLDRRGQMMVRLRCENGKFRRFKIQASLAVDENTLAKSYLGSLIALE